LKTASLRRVSRRYDYSGGIIGNISEKMRSIHHVKRADNVIFEPKGSASSRPGSRALVPGSLPSPAHSLGRYTNSLEKSGFVFAETAAGALYGLENGDTEPTLQTLPSGFTPTSAWWSFAQLNDVLYAAQAGDTQAPIAFITGGTNPSYTHTWKSTTLVSPVTKTAGSVATSATGVDAGIHYYRVRFMYRNGTSAASPISDAITTTTGSLKVNITLYAGQTDTASAIDPDFIYCRLERTKANAPVDGNWWWVANITKGTKTYEDLRADSDLFEKVDAGLFGTLPHMEGLVVFQRRLVGWSGSTVYVSQVPGDVQGTGPMNFDTDLTYRVGDDDGDTIQQVVVQGDRLVVFKSMSWYAMQGDPSDFSVVELGRGDGAAGPRCVTASGSTLFVLGGSGWRIMRSNSLEPFGDTEIGHYLNEMAEGLRYLCVARTYRGRFVLLWYPSTLSSYCDQTVGFDLVQRNFIHFADWPAADVLPLEATADFGNTTLISADPVNRGGATGAEVSDAWAVVWMDGRFGRYTTWVQKATAGGAMQWATNGIPTAGALSNPAMYTDVLACDDGGVVVAVARPTTSGYALEVQKYDPNGSPLWNKGAVVTVLSNTTTSIDGPVLYDGKDGTYFVSYFKSQSPWVPAVQKIDSDGTLLWTSGGVELDTGSSHTKRCFPNGVGGITCLWSLGTSWKMQDLDSDGVPLLATHGVVVFAGYTSDPHCEDASHNILMYTAWEQSGGGVRKIARADGSATWTTPGVFPFNGYIGTAACPDGSGGIFVVAIYGHNLWLRRVNSAVSLQWASAALVLSQSDSPIYTRAVADGGGGCYVATAGTVSSVVGVRVSHYSTAGALLAGPVLVKSGETTAREFSLISDGAGGCIVVFEYGADSDLYAQRYSSLLVEQWAVGGQLVCSALGNQTGVRASLVSAPASEAQVAKANLYPLWSLFKGRSERSLADGSAGVPLRFMMEEPSDDDGEPEVLKEYKRLVFEIDGDSGLLEVALNLSPGERTVSVPLTIKTAGYVWGDADAAVDDEDLVWADDDGSDGGEWAADESTEIEIGIREEAIGKACSTKLSAALTGALKITGHTLDWNRLPERKYTT
jgi:hypothetical protein